VRYYRVASFSVCKWMEALMLLIFLVTYLDVRDSDCSVHLRNNFFCIHQPMSITAVGLSDCVTRALSKNVLEVNRNFV